MYDTNSKRASKAFLREENGWEKEISNSWLKQTFLLNVTLPRLHAMKYSQKNAQRQNYEACNFK